jgi:CUG-BP- and ETR3-like factor
MSPFFLGFCLQGPPGANLFIFRIPDDFDDDKLLQTFVPFGKVIHAKVGMDRDTGKSKGFG